MKVALMRLAYDLNSLNKYQLSPRVTMLCNISAFPELSESKEDWHTKTQVQWRCLLMMGEDKGVRACPAAAP